MRATFAITLAALLTACGVPTNTGSDGGTSTGGWQLERVIDLGADCVNAGDLEIDGDLAFVACGGDFSGNGGMAVVDLTNDAVTLAAVGGAPGTLTVDGDRVLLGDMLDGRVLVAGTDGTIAHDDTDPVSLCPSDFGAGIYQFIPDVEVVGGVAYASCFATDEVIAFAVDASVADTNVRILGRATGGDGLSALRAWRDDTMVGLDNLAGTASRIALDPLDATASHWQTGDVPNDLFIQGDVAYITNSASNTVQALNLETGTTVAEIPTGDGTNPWSVVRVDPETLAVSLQLANEVAFIDLPTSEVTARVPMPEGEALRPFPDMSPLARPQGLALTADGRVVVSLTNFDESFAPAGHGLLAVIAPSAD